MNSLLLAVLQTLSWAEMDINQTLVLNRPIAINRTVYLPAGTKVHIDDMIPLDMIHVLTYQMSFDCDESLKNLETEIEIVDEMYGIKLDPGCKLEAFVENHDLNNPSWFDESSLL